MSKNGRRDRFIKTYSQGVSAPLEIWVDTETGVNYLFREGGLCPLLDKDGKPVVTPDETVGFKVEK